MQNFYKLLVNTLIANVTTSYLWFALSFWIYLETESVLATGLIGGSYMLLVAAGSLVFGTIVDGHRKKRVMLLSSVITLVMYLLAGLGWLLHSSDQVATLTHYAFWLFGGLILLGSVVESMRNIALSTCVTIMVPKNQRDKANGMVGTVQGVAFMVTSVFSGLSIGLLGMGWTLAIAIVLTAVALVHLWFGVTINEEKIVHDPELENKKVDLAGSLAAIRVVPGLLALIFFTTFNNFVGGVYMALMDPYGLTLFPVEVWGVILGITSTGFIVGGIIVAQKGLGKNPLKTMLLLMIVMAVLGMVFTIREWWWLYVIGIFMYMCLIPAVEAAEQTIIQRVVPLKRQGRVFGFAQAIESAAAPISAFAIAPLAQFWLIPYMRTSEGQATWSWLLGAGNARGIAFVLVLAGFVMLLIVLYAFTTKAYRILSAYYATT